MTDYASLKVPDLKKLLSERGLPQSGNKADLIARLQENDKSQAEDVIDWDDDDTKIAAVATKKDDPAPAPVSPAEAKETPAALSPAPAPAPAKSAKPAAPPADDGPAEEEGTPSAEPEKEGDASATTTDKPAETSSIAPLGLSATEAEAEQKKRADRAQRFGITVEKDSDEAKKSERAKRFGIESTLVPKGLDEALPERRPKRGREQGDDNQRGGKRQSLGDRNGRNRNNNNRSRGGRRGGGGGGGRNQTRGGGTSGILDDPAEKAKAERRAQRFGGGN